MIRKIPLLSLFPILATGLFMAPAWAGDSEAGKAKAQALCQTCHGMDGKATIPMAANLSGQQRGYLIEQLKAYRSGKRRHEQMSLIAKMLSDDDIENVAAWYAGIKITIEAPR